MTELLAYLGTGAIAGLLAGLLGIGGGLVIVPALAILFSSHGFGAVNLMHFAVGTSLATIVATSVSSMLAHQRRGSVHWQAVRGLLPGILLGGLAGAWLARQVSSTGLGLCFGLFEILVALQLLFGASPPPQRRLPGAGLQGLAGAVIGALSALLGIGGGTLTVPWLLWHLVDIRLAVGTAATIGLPIALAGTLGFALGGMQAGERPDYSTGFIYWPAVLGIVLGSVPLAPAGAWLAHYLPRRRLQRGFAVLLALIGLKMMYAAASG
jgi:uncharacterized membrane protein YfcA